MRIELPDGYESTIKKNLLQISKKYVIDIYQIIIDIYQRFSDKYQRNIDEFTMVLLLRENTNIVPLISITLNDFKQNYFYYENS